jgi:hypothetical protein
MPCRFTGADGRRWAAIALDGHEVSGVAEGGRVDTPPAPGVWFHSEDGETRFAPLEERERMTSEQVDCLPEADLIRLLARSQSVSRRG